ncbi:hypothetical protein NUSPORA_02995 [Nucleospora cyclopteri]
MDNLEEYQSMFDDLMKKMGTKSELEKKLEQLKLDKDVNLDDDLEGASDDFLNDLSEEEESDDELVEGSSHDNEELSETSIKEGSKQIENEDENDEKSKEEENDEKFKKEKTLL